MLGFVLCYYELGVIKNPDVPTDMYSDSQAAIYFSHSYIEKNRSKHISLRYHYLKEQISANRIKLSYIPTQQNVADILTKGLPKFRHHELIKNLGMGAFTKNKF